MSKKIDIDISHELEEIDKFFFRRRENNLFLSDYQIDILQKYGFNYVNYNSMKLLLYAILDYLDYSPNDELDFISKQISRIYLLCGNKKVIITE